jgi:hypothetical protein
MACSIEQDELDLSQQPEKEPFTRSEAACCRPHVGSAVSFLSAIG